MADIRIIPSSPATGGTTQQIATLARALRDGIDLGSRKAHIDALVLSLEETLLVMQCEAEPLLQKLDDDDPMKLQSQVSLDRLVTQIQLMINLVHRIV